MGTLENKLIWSISRINTLNFCARKYYFSYYQAWNGWEYSASPEIKTAYMLKNRQNIWGWIGDKTHKAIKTYLITPDPDEKMIKENSLQEMDVEFARSQQKTYLSSSGKLKDFGLIEHYQDKEISDNEFKEIKEKAIDNFEAFLRCKYLQGIIELKNEKDSLRLFEVDPGQDFNKMKFKVSEMNNEEIFALPDLCFEPKKGEYLIIDWKTGEYKKEGETPSTQLQTYGLRLQNIKKEINLQKEKVEAMEVYLPDFKEVGGILNSDHMGKIVDKIGKDLKEMNDYLLDINNNIPKERDFFLKTDSEGKCTVCQYKELCE